MREGHVAFDATFEVYPEVKLGDLSTVDVERVTADVTDEVHPDNIKLFEKVAEVLHAPLVGIERAMPFSPRA